MGLIHLYEHDLFVSARMRNVSCCERSGNNITEYLVQNSQGIQPDIEHVRAAINAGLDEQQFEVVAGKA